MNERLKELRKALKMNQTEFGTKLGVSRDSIANIEGDRVELKDAMVNLICRTFNVSETWLRTGEGEMFIEIDEEDELMEWAGRVLASRPEDFRRRFVKMLMKLSIEDWEILEAKVKELAGMEDEE